MKALLSLGLVLAPSAAFGANCTLMLLKDDLPDCVRDLNSKIFLLQAQVNAEAAQAKLYRGLTCLLAGELQRVGHSETIDEIRQEACAEMLARAKAKAAAKPKP